MKSKDLQGYSYILNLPRVIYKKETAIALYFNTDFTDLTKKVIFNWLAKSEFKLSMHRSQPDVFPIKWFSCLRSQNKAETKTMSVLLLTQKHV